MLCMDKTAFVLHSLLARDMLVKLQYGSSFDMARVTKVTVQYTSKYMLSEPKNMLLPTVALQVVSGQTPHMLRASQSVAAFKLKDKQVLGCAVTLRQAAMYTFLTACVDVVFPRDKDIASFPVFPMHTIVHIGLSQLLFFPALEKHVDVFEPLEGCAISVHTTAKSHHETLVLCSGLQLPCQPAHQHDEEKKHV